MSTKDLKPAHTMRVSITKYQRIEFKPECHLDNTAPCHLICGQGCEDVCGDPNDHLEPSDICHAVEWLTLDDPEDCYDGPDHPIYDGMPIEVEWTGDIYVWRCQDED